MHPVKLSSVLVVLLTISFAPQAAEMANTSRQAGLSEDGVSRIIELNKAAGRYILGGPWEAYAAARAAAMAGPAKSVAAGVGHALWDEKRTFAPLLVQKLEAWLKKYVTRTIPSSES